MPMPENTFDPFAVCRPRFFREALQARHLDEFFGLWCVMPDRFAAMAERFQGINLQLHLEQRQQYSDEDESYNPPYEVRDGIAMFSLSGTLTKFGSSYGGGTSTVRIRRQVRMAAADDHVRAGLFHFDSPGGTSAGTADLADDIRRFCEQKPAAAYCEDLCASAAYWLASQCPVVHANRSAMVGAIGTYAVVQDMSKAAEQLGVKVHVIRAGEFKGAGEPGTEITDEQLAEWQRLVDDTNAFFLEAVAKGRKLGAEKTKALADGRVHIGQAAKAEGLIDDVKTLDETFSYLRAQAQRTSSTKTNSTAKGARQMSEQQTAASPATYKELKAALPKATADFLTQCLDKDLSVEAARTAWMEELSSRNETLAGQLNAAQAAASASVPAATNGKPKAGKPKAGKACPKTEEEEEEDDEEGDEPQNRRPGVDPVGTRKPRNTAGYNGDARSDFSAAVREMMATRPGMTRMEATRLAARANPALHEAYVRATNRPTRKIQSLIGERFAAE